jgi:predicted ATP-grasp superfamily ATP-dependent carboligase
VLIAGVSTRAAAESAGRAGFDVTAIDAFADIDQHPLVRALSVSPRFTASAAAKAAREIECDAAVYLSTFENHPRAVDVLRAGRALWGNPPEVLRRVRDPILLTHTLRRHGCAAPDVYGRSHTFVAAPLSDREWLAKPRASGGGHGVRPWNRETLARGSYLQERVDGTPGSLVFVAAGGDARLLGVSRQLVGDPAFGAAEWRYCGSILASSGDSQFGEDETLSNDACALARVLAKAFGVIGVNGVDFVACRSVPYPVEVNPRWCASMELVEQAYEISVFGAHAAACRAGTLPDFDLEKARRAGGAVGKAVVYARHDAIVGDTRPWLPSHDDALPAIRDIPHPGQRIRAGMPVCTVFAEGRDDAACYASLVGRAELIHAEIAAWARADRML